MKNSRACGCVSNRCRLGFNPPVFCRMRGLLSAPPPPASQPTPQLALRCFRTPGLLFLFERLTLDSHIIREATQEPNHDGSGAVSGSLVDGRRTYKVCRVGAWLTLQKPGRPSSQIHEQRRQSSAHTRHLRISLQPGLVRRRSSPQQRPTARVALARAPAAPNKAPRLNE